MANIVERICKFCQKIFVIDYRHIKYCNGVGKNIGVYCSSGCSYQDKNKSISLKCSHCDCDIVVQLSQTKKSKSGRSFCSKSCSAKYNNTHKVVGNRRSKLEIWLEDKLSQCFPNIKMFFNKTEIINSELDVLKHFLENNNKI